MRDNNQPNDRLAWWVVAVVGLAPLPLASNRPIFWAGTALVVALGAALYGVSLFWSGRTLRGVSWRGALFAVPFAIVVAFLVVQVLPLAAEAGAARIVTAAGAAIESPTLSIVPGDTLLMLLRITGYALFFFLVLQVAANAARAEWLLKLMFAIIAGYAVLSLIMLTQLGDTLLIVDKWAYKGDATATFVNRNSFATFLAFGAVIGTVLVMGSRAPTATDSERPEPPGGWGRTIAIIVGLSFIFVALAATRSRMGLFAALVGSFVVVVLAAVKFRSVAARWVLIGVGLAGAGAAVLFVVDGGVLERLVSVEGSADDRLALYAQVVQMIAARPWFGYGGGSFEAAYPLFHQPPVSTDVIVDHAHSTYLTLWVELGVVVGTIPMLMVVFAAVTALRQYQRSPSHWAPPLAALGVIIAGAVHSTVDFSLEIEANVYMFLAIIAIGVARVGSKGGRSFQPGGADS